MKVITLHTPEELIRWVPWLTEEQAVAMLSGEPILHTYEEREDEACI